MKSMERCDIMKIEDIKKKEEQQLRISYTVANITCNLEK